MYSLGITANTPLASTGCVSLIFGTFVSSLPEQLRHSVRVRGAATPQIARKQRLKLR